MSQLKFVTYYNRSYTYRTYSSSGLATVFIIVALVNKNVTIINWNSLFHFRLVMNGYKLCSSLKNKINEAVARRPLKGLTEVNWNKRKFICRTWRRQWWETCGSLLSKNTAAIVYVFSFIWVGYLTYAVVTPPEQVFVVYTRSQQSEGCVGIQCAIGILTLRYGSRTLPTELM